MFFARSGLVGLSELNKSEKESKVRRPRPSRRPRMAALSLAVAIAVPAALSCCADSALAQEPANQNQPAMTTGELLRMGVSQYDKGQYEESLATLTQIKPEDLSEKDQRTLSSARAKAETASNAR